ncbi:hypothetical protein KBA41_18730 [Candidatus Ozemobacteraceae bacterium]|nr:hypothetical protein [Candidatus Ozemobacteraceae bacterium]
MQRFTSADMQPQVRFNLTVPAARGSLRAGRIRVQLIAMMLLGISISMFISAGKSLSREFVGLVADTHAEEGLRSGYWLDLAVTDGLSGEEASKAFLNAVRGTHPTRRVGVSSMVYDQAKPLFRVSKEAWSPFIYIEEERHIDLGIKWLIWGIIGVCAAIIIHGKTHDRDILPIPSLTDDDETAEDEDHTPE